MVKNYRVQLPQRLQHPDIVRPEPPTINPVSAGENVHPEGTGIANYWIHMNHERPDGGGGSDLFQVKENGTWRSLNPITILSKGTIIKARQSEHEFDPIEKHSDEVQITVS